MALVQLIKDGILLLYSVAFVFALKDSIVLGFTFRKNPDGIIEKLLGIVFLMSGPIMIELLFDVFGVDTGFLFTD